MKLWQINLTILADVADDFWFVVGLGLIHLQPVFVYYLKLSLSNFDKVAEFLQFRYLPSQIHRRNDREVLQHQHLRLQAPGASRLKLSTRDGQGPVQAPAIPHCDGPLRRGARHWLVAV